MNRTKIEWVKNPDGTPGYTWNPITGCLNNDNGLCKGGGFPCYAYKLAHGRLKQRYLVNTGHLPPYKPSAIQTERHLSHAPVALDDPFYPRFWEERLYHPWGGEPKGIFVCDMSDLFGIGIPKEWTQNILNLCALHEQNRYYLLTKQAQRLPEFSPFPDNCWVGVTATSSLMAEVGSNFLDQIEAKVKYISFEPLLQWELDQPDTETVVASLDLVIIGACTGTVKEMSHLVDKYPHLTPMPYGKKWTAQPKIEWVREIVEAADKARVKVFLKDNLYPIFNVMTESDALKLHIKFPWTFSRTEFSGETDRIKYHGKMTALRQEMPEIRR